MEAAPKYQYLVSDPCSSSYYRKDLQITSLARALQALYRKARTHLKSVRTGSMPSSSPEVRSRCLARRTSAGRLTCDGNMPMFYSVDSWLYRIRPSVTHIPYSPCAKEFASKWISNFEGEDGLHVNPNQIRWKPQPLPEEKTTFIEGIVTIGGAGSPALKVRIHTFSENSGWPLYSPLCLQLFDGRHCFLLVRRRHHYCAAARRAHHCLRVRCHEH